MKLTLAASACPDEMSAAAAPARRAAAPSTPHTTPLLDGCFLQFATSACDGRNHMQHVPRQIVSLHVKTQMETGNCEAPAASMHAIV